MNAPTDGPWMLRYHNNQRRWMRRCGSFQHGETYHLTHTIAITDDGGWLLGPVVTYTPLDFGAVGDGITDCTTVQVGEMLYGFCSGFFGRDSYADKRVEGVGVDWIVAREDTGKVVFASQGDWSVDDFLLALRQEQPT